MTAVTRLTQRQLDRYYSPCWMADALFQVLPSLPPRTVFLECCAGAGAIASVVRRRGYTCITADFDAGVEPDYWLDMTQSQSWDSLPHFDAVISNLPFNQADRILSHALARCRNVFVLLRKTWDEPTRSRADLLKQYPWNAKIVLPRYRFLRKRRRDGALGAWQTDSAPLDWFLWTTMPVPVLTVYTPQDISEFSTFTANPDQEYAARHDSALPPL